MKKIKKLIVKIGTNVLTRADGLLDLTTISQLVDQIAVLKQEGWQLIVVSSGAVGAGKSMIQLPASGNKTVRRQVLSAVGQIRLMQSYSQLLANYQLHCAQVLATKEDFRDRRHYLNMKNCFQALLRDNLIPIVNENDVISVNELMFTDNDELAGLIATMMGADALMILSNVDGVFDGPPQDNRSKVIPVIEANDRSVAQLIAPERSSLGRGGMRTKLRMAQKTARLGIDVYIGHGKRPGVLTDLLQGQFSGTRFPANGKLSNVKKWMATQSFGAQATIIINAGAAAALQDIHQANSLLPVGILHIDGDFVKGEVVMIQDESGQNIGLGMAQYQSDKARKWIGQQGKKPIIHYDYLLLEK